MTFTNTINPYNRNSNGAPKNIKEVQADVFEERDEWVASPIRHDHEGYWKWTEGIRKKYDAGKKVAVQMSCGFEIEVQKKI